MPHVPLLKLIPAPEEPTGQNSDEETTGPNGDEETTGPNHDEEATGPNHDEDQSNDLNVITDFGSSPDVTNNFSGKSRQHSK